MRRITDPFLSAVECYNRLLNDYRRHESLVVAVDFDNTIYDFHNKGYIFDNVISLIKDCNELGFKVVIFSSSPKSRHAFIRKHCEEIGIKIDGINEDVVDFTKGGEINAGGKIYYNIFLDDRAGLGQAYDTLNSLVQSIKVSKLQQQKYEKESRNAD